MTAQRARIGRIGETLAARHLQAAGYDIVARNWRCAAGPVRGELDLICRDETTIVFCEVKTRRRASDAEPAESVDARKLLRLRRLAAVWLAGAGLGGVDVRFDVVAVSWPPTGGGARIVHLRNVG